MRHLYRKAFESAFEAEETAKGIVVLSNIDHPGDTDVWIAVEDETHYVYVALVGKVDFDTLLAATGYERVS